MGMNLRPVKLLLVFNLVHMYALVMLTIHLITHYAPTSVSNETVVPFAGLSMLYILPLCLSGIFQDLWAMRRATMHLSTQEQPALAAVSGARGSNILRSNAL